MRIEHFTIQDVPPLKRVTVDQLSDVVVLAGPNGVGKTTVLKSILGAFRRPQQSANVSIRVVATRKEEVAAWNGKAVLDTKDGADAVALTQFLQRKQKRGRLRSSVLNFDSDRVIEQIKPLAFTWSFPDPDEEPLAWTHTFQSAKSRFEDVVHSLFKKTRARRDAIGAKGLELIASGERSMVLDFPDPLDRFRDAFKELLPGKTMLDLDQQTQEIQYQTNGVTLKLSALSSGEREVVTIVFDFLLRDPKHCIIVFDEPELHLHPELSYRLLRTLRTVGSDNQFVFCTHSPDIIAASLDQSVVFVAPATEPSRNQAVRVSDADEVADVLHVLGQSVGVISLGKRIVLIEGEKSSLDKQVYGSIVGSEFPELVLVPAGGKETIASFMRALDSVLSQTVWGVDFFMLCDGDSAVSTSNASELEQRSSGRLKFLSRYHLENYFLDESVLAKVFEEVGTEEGSWLLEPGRIKEFLLNAVKEFMPYATALAVAHRVRLGVGNVDIMPKSCNGADLGTLLNLFEGMREKEANRVGAVLSATDLPKLVEEEYRRIAASVESGTDDWKCLVPGRPLLGKLAKQAKTDVGNMKRVFIRVAAGATPSPFQEIRTIFQGFASHQAKR